MPSASRIPKHKKKQTFNRPKLQKVEILKGKIGKDKRSETSAHFITGDVLAAIKRIPKESCDLIISSPPYNIGKDYERFSKLSFGEYIKWQNEVITAVIDRLRSTGSICWQVGSYVACTRFG